MQNRAGTTRQESISESPEPIKEPLRKIEKIKKEIFNGQFINLELIADTLVDEYTKLSK